MDYCGKGKEEGLQKVIVQKETKEGNRHEIIDNKRWTNYKQLGSRQVIWNKKEDICMEVSEKYVGKDGGLIALRIQRVDGGLKNIIENGSIGLPNSNNWKMTMKCDENQ